MGLHAMPLVTFFLISPCYFKMSCHGSHHPVIYRECYGFERKFFYAPAFFTLHSFLQFSRLPWDRQCNLKVSKTSCWPSKHGLTINLNHNNPRKGYSGSFYLRVMAGRLAQWRIYLSYGIRTLFHNRWACQLYPVGHRGIQSVIN